MVSCDERSAHYSRGVLVLGTCWSSQYWHTCFPGRQTADKFLEKVDRNRKTTNTESCLDVWLKFCLIEWDFEEALHALALWHGCPSLLESVCISTWLSIYPRQISLEYSKEVHFNLSDCIVWIPSNCFALCEPLRAAGQSVKAVSNPKVTVT